MRKCEICGSTKRVTHYRRTKYLCRKHYEKALKEEGRSRTIHSRNEIVYSDGYAEIILYNIRCEEVARTKINLEDVDKVKQFKWGLTEHGYVVALVEGKRTYLHKFLIDKNNSSYIDHINGNRLDNRKSNLRKCTNQQNCCNTRLSKNNSSGITGVYWSKEKNKWTAQIMVNRKCIYLGRYDNIDEAIKARREAEYKYFGKFSPNAKSS